jgi:arylsulfatase A-like enzyme
MSRRALAGAVGAALLGAAALWAAGVFGPGPQPAATGPNVLIVLWDTVRADRMSLYGHDKPTTPRLDAFAADAWVFERAKSPAIWTPPSHASLFTGFMPTRHGVKATYKWLDGHHVTLAEWLGDHGWDTFAFSANPYIHPDTALTQGFRTVTHAFEPPYKGAARRATRAKLLPDDASTDISPRWKPQPGQPAAGAVAAYKDAGPVAVDALSAWLDARPDPDQPWFAFVNLMEAHIPRVPSQASRDLMLDADDQALAKRTDVAQINLLAYTFGVKDYTPDELRAVRGVYDAAVRDLDDATAALFAALEARGDLDDTVILLTADHGENLGDHHMFGHKYAVWDTLLHVPLVIRPPAGHARAGGRRVDTPVSMIHAMATVLDLVGLPLPPTDPDGARSLLDLPVEPVFSELLEATPVAIQRIDKLYGLSDITRWMRTFEAVEHDGWKLVHASDGDHDLFHLPTDPGELHDRLDAEPAEAARLRALLEAHRASQRAWDASRADKPGAVTVQPGAREMLEQLGYMEPEP